MEASGTLRLSFLPSGHAGGILRANSEIPYSYLFLKPQLNNSSSSSIRLSSSGRVKCSFDYFNSNSSSNNTGGGGANNYDGFSSGSPQYPRPTEIPWKKELCNVVQLIGNVAVPVQIKELSGGKAVAWSRIAVKKSPTETNWINLTFWDELAHVANQHLEKGQQIYVMGRLVTDTVDSDGGKKQTFYKVVVQELNLIERSASPVALYDGESNAPAYGKKQNNYGANNTTGSVEELWQAFFANPTEWWDNRKNKRSPNYPDFKHKDTGEALWVEGRTNPPWVKSQLSILDSRMESFQEQNGSRQYNSMSTDNFSSF